MRKADPDDVAKRLLDAVEALNRGDFDPYIGMMDPQFEIYDESFPEPIRGREVVRKINEGLGKALPDMKFNVLSTAVGDGVVALEAGCTATFKGALTLPTGTIPPTGRPIEFRYVAMYRFNPDGSLTSVRNYGPSVRQMLGLEGSSRGSR